MGLIEKEESSIKYLHFFNGKICCRSHEGDEKAVARVNKEGRRVYERLYTGIEGVIRDIFIRESEYGKELCLLLQDNDQYFQVQCSFNSKQSRIILFRLPELNFKHTVRLNAFMGDNGYTAIAIRQDGKVVPSHFTKEKPNGLPDLKIIRVNDEEKYDGTKRNEFLRRMIQVYIYPQLNVDTLMRNRTQIFANQDEENSVQPDRDVQESQYPEYYDTNEEEPDF